jgi:hypothetical protein
MMAETEIRNMTTEHQDCASDGSLAKSKRTGRPRKYPSGAKRPTLTFRIKDDVHARLKAASELSCRSLSEEIEYRIEQSLLVALLPSQLAIVVARWRIGNLEEREAEQEWLPIETAPRENSTEILGCCYAERRMVREPFVSFWSPTLNKFFGSPNYWVPLPKLPTPKGSAS